MTEQQTVLEAKIAAAIAPMLADGRTAGSDGVPRVGRATKKKADAIARTVLAVIRGESCHSMSADQTAFQRDLIDAVWQALDDMGASGLTCTLESKAKLRVAIEPFLTADVKTGDPNVLLDWTLDAAARALRGLSMADQQTTAWGD